MADMEVQDFKAKSQDLLKGLDSHHCNHPFYSHKPPQNICPIKMNIIGIIWFLWLRINK